MKIAVASDDGTFVSQHFGHAPYYVVFTVEDGQVTGREVRDKPHHGSQGAPHHGQPGRGAHHEGGQFHGRMASSIADCSAVLVGGIGAGAYNSLVAQGIVPARVRPGAVEDAVSDYLAGRTLEDHTCQH